MPLIKNVLKPLAKSDLIPLELTATASATDAAIHKKIFGSVGSCVLVLHPLELGSHTTTLTISNEEMNENSSVS